MMVIQNLNENQKAVLCCVPYLVTETDGQVIFEEKSGFAYTFGSFTLEWFGCGWYLVDFESSSDGIFVAHIAAALKRVEENYTYKFDNGTCKSPQLKE